MLRTPLLAAFLTMPAFAQPVISPLSLTNNETFPFTIADDGSWTGYARINNRSTSVYCSASGQFVDIHAQLGIPEGGLRRVSADGRTAILWRVVPEFGTEYFLWSLDAGPIPFPSSPGEWSMAEPRALSGDGSLIAARFADAQRNSMTGLWSAAEGFERTPPFEFLSADGRVMVGHNETAGYRRTPLSAQPQAITLGPAAANSVFLGAISNDGRIILGKYSLSGTRRSFVWTLARGSVLIPNLSPGVSFLATSMSASGSIAVGDLNNDFSRVGSAVWTYMHGLVRFEDFLAARNIDTAGWSDLIVKGISPDGTMMVGEGTHSSGLHGWIIRDLPPSTSCAGDFNGDRFMDWRDYGAFVDAFERGLPSVDLNTDGMIDFFDYAEFVEAFEVGC